MTNSDDEYGFDDLVLDDRTLAVLDATERNFTTLNAHTRPRSSPERQPTKRLKTNQGWVPLHGRQEREMSPAPRGLTRSGFSLEDTDLPEITISNGFYSRPGPFFVGSPQSQPSASPNTQRELLNGTGSDVVLLPTPTVRHVHAPGRGTVAPPNRQPRVSPPVPPTVVSVPSTERSLRSVVALGSGNPPPHDPSPARASPLARTSSFSDGMRAALLSAMSGADGSVLQRSPSTPSSDTPSPLSATPQAYSQRPPLPNQTQVVVHSRPERPSHLLHRERSLPPTQRLQVARQPSPHQPTGSQYQPSPSLRNAPPIGDTPSVRVELESLRSEVEELKRRNAEQQRTLDQAVNEKRAKIGEVEILRANLQKAATAHNEETAKLRAAKENLEAAQVAAQKKQEAELERLRTQLVFKQHEMEASRKAVPRAPALSQAPASSQMPRWDVPSTPRRHHRPPSTQSPSPHHQKRSASGSSKMGGAPKLPGFVNDFAMAPLKKAKGTARAYTSHFEQSQGMRERDLDPPRTQIEEHMEVDRHYGDSSQVGVADHYEVDLHMDSGDDVKALQPQHVAGSSRTAKPFDWLGWMRQLVLAHSMSPTAPSTIQLLLTQPPFEANHATTFPLACTSLMDAVAASAGSYDPIARVVVDSLAQIVNTLLISVRLKPLVSTLNLLGVLVISLPSFATNLLKPTNGPTFLEIICTIIVNLLQPSNTNSTAREKAEESKLYLTLAREVFGLLDAITYSLPPEYHYQLAIIPQTTNVLTTMLSNQQPTSFLECSTRTLSYLSTRTGLFRPLMSFTDEIPENARDFTKLPQVDRMCALLVDPNRRGIEGHSIRVSVLTTLISLAMAHDDALTILSESPFFVPSLVAMLADLSTALWEEEPELMASPELLSEAVAGIARGVLLLHYVVFRAPKGPASLRARLQAAPPRHFNGIGHQFVVALGRLSFAEPPDEVSAQDRGWLEQLADPARDVMDLVMAGPESESVWSLFQEEDEEEQKSTGANVGVGHGGATTAEGEEDIVMQADIGMLYDDDSQLEYM
ncbi:hypothetical protein BJY52DRAFT_1189808 [Lactarius psammicola]|nr:hypothetical protein BJY52DRAFT_1189808 [Lactarius psammicola]